MVGDRKLKIVVVSGQAGLQGASVTLQDVSPDVGFFSSDIYVTPNGDILVLGYFAVEDRFTPRLFLGRAGGASTQQSGAQIAPILFREIFLGLSGNWLDAIFGSPRMRLVSFLYPGNVIAFWAVKQLSTEQSELYVIKVDLDEIELESEGQQPAILGPGVIEIFIKLIVAAAVLQTNIITETTILLLGNSISPLMGFVYMDFHWRLILVLFDCVTGAIKIKPIVSLLLNFNALVKLSAACGILGNTYVCSLNAAGQLFSVTGRLATQGSEPIRTLIEKLKSIRRMKDNFGCWLNFCKYSHVTTGGHGPGHYCWDGLGYFFFNKDFTEGRENAGPAGETQSSFGFRPLYTGSRAIVPQLVQGQGSSQPAQGQGFTEITVSNPQDLAQSIEYEFTAQDGTIFQSGTDLLQPSQTLTLQVEGNNLQPGAATFFSAFPVTVQSLVDLSSVVATPIFGAPGVDISTEWTLPFENPAGTSSTADPVPAGGSAQRETGVAVMNFVNEANTCTFTAYGPDGAQDAQESRDFLALQQQALFVGQLLSGLSSSSGLLRVECDSPVAVVGAQQDSAGAIVLTPARPEPTPNRP